MIRGLQAKGLSLSEIARRSGLERKNVILISSGRRSFVRADTLAALKSIQTTRRQADEERIMILHDEGHTAEEIAEFVGCSSRTIWRVLAAS